MVPFTDSVFLRKMRDASPISEGTAEILASYLEPCHFAKKELVLKAGVFCRYIWLIEKGSLRHYWLMEDGREINTSFSIEGHMVFSMDEVYFGKTSEEYAQTMEPVDAWRIPVGDMNRLFRENLELCNWDASSTRTSTGDFTAPIKRGLRSMLLSATCSSASSSQKCAGEPTLDTLLHISEYHNPR